MCNTLLQNAAEIKKEKSVVKTDCQCKCHQHERPPGAEMGLEGAWGAFNARAQPSAQDLLLLI